MIRLWGLTLLLALFGTASVAETLVATRTLRAQTILTPQDVAVVPETIPGMADAVDLVVGLETRSIIYAGRPIPMANLGPAAIVERNQIVPLVYSQAGLMIVADGRSMERAGPGDVIRVMNLASKNTVSGVVAPNGAVHVGGLTAKY